MPSMPPTPCCWPGCGALAAGRHCEAHARAQRRRDEARTDRSHKRLYGRRWRKARLVFLRAHPRCMAGHCDKASREVDHIEPHRGDQRLFWQRANWQALCKPHHSAKTARESGAFGRPL